MEIEAQVYDICASNGIPASEVLSLDRTRSVIDREFMIVRYIPSCNFYELQDEGARPRLMEQFGAALAKMNAVTAPRFGRIDTVTAGGGYDRWSEFLLSEIDEWTPLARNAALMDEDELCRLRRVFADHALLLDEITVPCLVHTDLGPGNLLVRTDGERPEFGAIIDPDRAFFGDPMFEFCQITWMLGDDFLRGYGHALPSDAHSLRRRRLYRAMRLCWDAYVWEMEYNKHEYMLSSMNIVRQIMNECERVSLQ
jgi:aminoglycoside phosphotransferase (APT) family kinase protein